MVAFLDAHAGLGDVVVCVILDEVGIGKMMSMTSDGLILKRTTHRCALNLAGRAGSALPDADVGQQAGIAYTDAVVATKRGLVAMTLDALLLPDEEEGVHWHEMPGTRKLHRSVESGEGPRVHVA